MISSKSLSISNHIHKIFISQFPLIEVNLNFFMSSYRLIYIVCMYFRLGDHLSQAQVKYKLIDYWMGVPKVVVILMSLIK